MRQHADAAVRNILAQLPVRRAGHAGKLFGIVHHRVDIDAAHHLRPILCILAECDKIAEALLQLAQLERARAGGVFLVAGGAEALQDDPPADPALVNGDDLVHEVDLNGIAVRVGVIIVHLACHARQHRRLRGQSRDQRNGCGKAKNKCKQAFLHHDSSIRYY